MATPYEAFVNLELPRRPVMLTYAVTSYDGDPNDSGAPAIVTGAPVGTFYLQQTGGILWQKKMAIAGSYTQVGGGGGGGGVTLYPTEALLLAASPAAGAMGYAQDTDNFWFRRALTWQPIPNFSVLRQSEGTVFGTPTIYVDDATGDDSDWNDGTVTPLKSLDALFRRLPARMAGGGANFIQVSVGPGDYTFTDPWALVLDMPGSVWIQGSHTAPFDSFSIDSFSGDDCHVNKPGTDPAWTADEWVGYWIEVMQSGSPQRYPILANGTHDLTIGTRTAGNWTGVSLGSTAHIVKKATRWTGPDPVQFYGQSALYFVDILFDRPAVGGFGYFYQLQGMLSFIGCHFKCANTGGNVVFATGPACYIALNNSLVENGFGPLFVHEGTIDLYGISLLNTARFLEGRYCTLRNYETINTRASGDIFFPAYDCSLVDRSGRVMMIGGGSLWSSQNRGNRLQLLVSPTVLDGQAPSNWVYLVPNCQAYLGGVPWPEASTPANSIVFQGPAGIIGFSMADLDALYDGDYDYGYAARVTRTG